MTRLSLLFLCLTGLAQAEDVLTVKQKGEVVETIGKRLINRYIFPEVGRKAGDYLKQQLADGAYKEMTDPNVFAKQLTADLRKITNDLHIRVKHRPPRVKQGVPIHPLILAIRDLRKKQSRNYGFARVEILDGNVGLLELRGFSERQVFGPHVIAAMKFLENTDAVILDLRKNGGGSPDTVRYLSSYFIGKGVHLNSIYKREGDSTKEFWTLDEVPGKRRTDVPVFVLTSKRTGSGGEGCAYIFQTQKRGKLIGEVTAGAANPGGMVPVSNYFACFVPDGRPINPITQTNWEGVGVKPDQEVSKEEAEEVALVQAREAAKKYREQRDAAMVAWVALFGETRVRAISLFKQNKEEQGRDLIGKILAEGFVGGHLDEELANDVGYHFLENKKAQMAEAVFHANAVRYPGSPNAFDSWGDSLRRLGRKQAAREAYTKAVALAEARKDPGLELFRRNLASMAP